MRETIAGRRVYVTSVRVRVNNAITECDRTVAECVKTLFAQRFNK